MRATGSSAAGAGAGANSPDANTNTGCGDHRHGQCLPRHRRVHLHHGLGTHDGGDEIGPGDAEEGADDRALHGDHDRLGQDVYDDVAAAGAGGLAHPDLLRALGHRREQHVTLDEQGGVVLDAVIKGDTVREVLQYVDFDTNALVAKLRTDAETAVRENRMSYEESGRLLKFYEEGLGGYTYLE